MKASRLLPWALSFAAAAALVLLLLLAAGRLLPPAREAGRGAAAGGQSTEAVPADAAPAVAAVEALVTDREGAPVSGARVSLWSSGSAAAFETTSDAHGAARLPGVTPGRYAASAETAALVSPVPAEVVARPGETARVTLVLEPGFRIGGSVLLAGTGAPVEGACLALRPRGHVSRLWCAESGAGGAFSLAPLAEGSYTLTVARSGLGRMRLASLRVDGETPALAVKVELSATTLVAGRVVSPEGDPVAGARVAVAQAIGKAKAAPPSPVSFDDVELPPPLTSPRLIPSGHLGVMKGPIPDFPASAPQAPLPPDAAPLAAQEERQADAEAACPCMAQAGGAWGSGRPVLSGPDGAFTLDARPGAPLTLVVQHPDFAPRTVALEKPGAAAQGGPVEIVLARGFDLAGRIVDEEGRPVPGATLWVDRPESGIVAAAPVAPDGSFVVAHAAGTVVLGAQAEGFSLLRWKAQLAGAPPPAPVTLVLTAADKLVYGSVVDERGFPVVGATAKVEASDGAGGVAARAAVSDGDGVFSFATLPPGAWKVTIRHASRATLATTKEGWEGQEEFVLAPPGGVSGKVTDERTYLPVARFTVTFTSASGATKKAAFDAGVFALADLPAGQGAIAVAADGYAPQERAVSLPPAGETGEISLEDEDFWLLPE